MIGFDSAGAAMLVKPLTAMRWLCALCFRRSLRFSEVFGVYL